MKSLNLQYVKKAHKFFLHILTRWVESNNRLLLLKFISFYMEDWILFDADSIREKKVRDCGNPNATASPEDDEPITTTATPTTTDDGCSAIRLDCASNPLDRFVPADCAQCRRVCSCACRRDTAGKCTRLQCTPRDAARPDRCPTSCQQPSKRLSDYACQVIQPYCYISFIKLWGF